MSFFPYNKNPSGIAFFGSVSSDALIASDSRLIFNSGTGQLILDNKPVSVSGHAHSASDINNFSSSVSGLLPITQISGGSNISVITSGSLYSISVSGQLGLTGEEVDDRVSQLLVAGNNVVLNYNDNANTLTISTSGLQPSGNYSLVGHSHVIADVSGLQSSLDGKQPSGIYASGIHTHLSSDITDFNASVSGLLTPYALLNSPSFSGTPTAPTASSGNNSSQIANTAFVRGEISSLVGSAPSTLDTLNELATALGNDPNFATTITNSLSNKVSKSGDIMTGNLTAPSGFFNALKVNNIDVSLSGHTHQLNDIINFASGVSGIIDDTISTALQAGSNINLFYDTDNDYLTISATGVALSGHQHSYLDITDLSFNSNDFITNSGNISINISGVDNNQLKYSYVTLGLSTINLGESTSIISGLSLDGGSP